MIFFFLNEQDNYLIFTQKGVVKPALREFVMERPLKDPVLGLPSLVEQKKQEKNSQNFIIKKEIHRTSFCV